jgi:3-hydroxybutyrate dehydrogenase
MLAGRCALITGSTQGLGAAIADALAGAGCNIVLNGLGDAREIETQRRKLEAAYGVRAIFHGADLAQASAVGDLVRTAFDTFGAVDILVNNAVVRHFAPIEQMAPEAWENALAVNLTAAFHTTRLTLPRMRERDFGRIVNISSVYGLIGTTNRVDYVTTKTALIGFTRAVALETAGQKITCNVLCPGTSLTPPIAARIDGVMAAEGLSRDEAARKFLSARQPNGRFVSGENLAALVLFLCGPAGADITGAALPIDGGWAAS